MPFLLTPQQHRDRAAHLRRQGSEAALQAAERHEMIARMIEKRLEREAATYPLALE